MFGWEETMESIDAKAGAKHIRREGHARKKVAASAALWATPERRPECWDGFGIICLLIAMDVLLWRVFG
jgi:hypothetical protein